MTTKKIVRKILDNHPKFVVMMKSVGYTKKYLINKLCCIANKFVFMGDHDGVLGETNSVKDRCLNAFCEMIWGKVVKNTELPTSIHRRMHGRPMGEIFVAIAKDCYNTTINLTDGEKITAQLNDYIRPEYIKRRMYEGAYEFLSILKEIGTPMFILTGMEPDMIEERFRYHKFDNIFNGILGAPQTKEQNIAEILKKYPGRRILATGDAISEFKATMAYDGTVFLAFDMEKRERRVFPDEVNILTSYGTPVWKELFRQI